MKIQTKICGVTNVADALIACQAGADAIGLNFFSGSKRFVSVSDANQIVSSIRNDRSNFDVFVAGVFADLKVEQIVEIANTLQLDLIQLHGHYEPEDCLKFQTPLIYVLGFEGNGDFDQSNLGERSLESDVRNRLQKVIKQKAPVRAVIIDKKSGDQFGGTGQTLPWDGMNLRNWEKFLGVPIILAGGLKPENVAEAIDLTEANGVDVAGGVEERPGVKSAKKVQSFIQNAQDAFQAR